MPSSGFRILVPVTKINKSSILAGNCSSKIMMLRAHSSGARNDGRKKK